MSINDHDDDLEARLRRELTTPRSSDHLDIETFLADVHHGTTVRRVKRRATLAVAAVLAVVGGGVIVNAAGVLDQSRTPEAGRSATNPPSTNGGLSGQEKFRFTTTPATSPRRETVTLTPPSGGVRAAAVTPVSLTATGTDHQWLLVKTPGHGCGGQSCASVLSTDQHGQPGHWADLGALPAPPATTDNPTPDSVSSLRFAKRTDGSGIYDGWAYGQALWSTHDSGVTWSDVDSPRGKVTQLEAWGKAVYATVSVPGSGLGSGSVGATSGAASGATAGGVDGATAGAPTGSDLAPPRTILYRSPTETDDWQPVNVGRPLTDVVALTAAEGVVALIDTEGLHSTVYVTSDGVTWTPQPQACPAGTNPVRLSSAGDATTGVASLWVTCTDATSSVVRSMATDSWYTWTSARGTFGPGVMVAGRTPTKALAAGGGVVGVESISATEAPVSVYPRPVGAALFFGFTNERYGYLLDASGAILSTTDGGHSWSRYAAVDTLR